MSVSIDYFLWLSALLFAIGFVGILYNVRNVIGLLMSIELMLAAVNVNLVGFSGHLGDLTGQLFSIFVLTVAAAETAVGLALVVLLFRRKGNIDLS